MELKTLLSILSVLLGLLGNHNLVGPRQAPTPGDRGLVSVAVEVSLEIPSFVRNFPKDHFAGISAPMPTVAEARRSALDDVVRQVLGSMGATYEHQYSDLIRGNIRNPERLVNDRLSSISRGILSGLEQNIVQSAWSRDHAGRYVCFVLVHFPQRLIEKARRLTKGACVLAAVLSEDRHSATLRVQEINGVSITLASAEVSVTKRNHFAKAISFFVWKVPTSSEQKSLVPIDPVSLCGDAAEVKLHFKRSGKRFTDHLVGATLELTVVLSGQDEIGRPVHTHLTF